MTELTITFRLLPGNNMSFKSDVTPYHYYSGVQHSFESAKNDYVSILKKNGAIDNNTTIIFIDRDNELIKNIL